MIYHKNQSYYHAFSLAISDNLFVVIGVIGL